MKEEIKKEIELGEAVTASLDGSSLTIKGPKGEVVRDFSYPKVKIVIEEGKIILFSEKATKREKKMVGSFESHIKNIVKGVVEPHEYKLKICSGHFPMNVAVKGDEFIIKNFLGEKVPRVLKIKKEVNVKVDRDIVVVESPDKELAGQLSADIELLTKRTGYDQRIFQDGVYIISKVNKEKG